MERNESVNLVKGFLCWCLGFSRSPVQVRRLKAAHQRLRWCLGFSRFSVQGRRLKAAHQRSRWCLGSLSFSWLLILGGCASYQFGSASLYPSDIRTVHIPVVRNDSFRHDLGPQLTDALVKEVERRTPYKVVSNPNADSTLRCAITSQSKVVLTETSSDDPRALDSAIVVGATWTSRDGRRLMQNSMATVDSDSTGFSQSVRFVPEAGQSIDTANQEAINSLARRIVSQMESRW